MTTDYTDVTDGKGELTMKDMKGMKGLGFCRRGEGKKILAQRAPRTQRREERRRKVSRVPTVRRACPP